MNLPFYYLLSLVHVVEYLKNYLFIIQGKTFNKFKQSTYILVYFTEIRGIGDSLLLFV